ncbi:MAG: C1 family peptidase [Candidatus Eisenbacteria bacterium]
MDISSRYIHIAIGLALAAGLLFGAASGSRAQVSVSDAPVYGRGYVPPEFDHPDVAAGRMPRTTLPLPTRYDWRDLGVVTLVQDQGSCGTCFAFAALADFESELLIDGESLYDFSENNVKECYWYGSACQGGNYWRVANFLSKQGTVLESCDPYASYVQFNCRDYCDHIKTLLDWRVISYSVTPDEEVLKSYIYDHGPIFTAIYVGDGNAWANEFANYDGSYTLYHPGGDVVNHAVVIVGWDDDLTHPGGQGAWIVKNSWGKSWGGPCGYGTEGGYFTIAYGSAKIGQEASFLYEWQDYDPSGDLLHYDEAGYTMAEGYPGSNTAWGFCKYIPASSGTVERVEFFAVDEITDVDVYVYDDFTGGSLTNLLGNRLNVSFEHPGYHSVELTTPVGIGAGDDIYVMAKITYATFAEPLPADDQSTQAAGKSYKSPNGNTWYQVLGRDLGIRARVVWDAAAPAAPSTFGAVGSDTTVTLSWVNPGDEDFEHTLIVYSETDYPANPSAGTPVENGAGGKFHNSPSSSDGFVHTRLENDVTYYYSAFAGDIVPNYSVAVTASATAEDSVPPGAVSAFTATGSDRSVTLGWTGPSDLDLTGVLISYSTDGPLSSPAGGQPVENGNNGVFDAIPAWPDSFTHTGLINETTYYYCITAFDEMINYSPIASDSAYTQDLVPPGLAISVLQNPYLTSYLDIYITLSEAIVDSSFFVRVGLDVPEPDEDLVPEAVPGTSVFRCDYTLQSGGLLRIEACGRDLNSNWAQEARAFGASLVLARSGGVARSVDGCLEVALPAGTVSGDMYVVIMDDPVSTEGLISAYKVSPPAHELDGAVTISMAYDQSVCDPRHLCIARVEDGQVIPLESYVDEGKGTVIAHAVRFGTYGLYRDEEISSRDYGSGELRLLQNVPNPFKATTSIAFEAARPTWLRLDVVSVDGRQVTRLWEGVASPGAHQIPWDGTDRRSRRVASGVYYYVVTTEAGTATRKMVLLQ